MFADYRPGENSSSSRTYVQRKTSPPRKDTPYGMSRSDLDSAAARHIQEERERKNLEDRVEEESKQS